jgi:hypothetical protein
MCKSDADAPACLHVLVGVRLQGVTRLMPSNHVLPAACTLAAHASSEPSIPSLRRPRSSKGSVNADDDSACDIRSQQTSRLLPFDVAVSQQHIDSPGAFARADVDGIDIEVADEASQQYSINNDAEPAAPPYTANKQRACTSAAPRQTSRYNTGAAAAPANLVNQPRTAFISSQLGWYDGRDRRSSTGTLQRAPQAHKNPAAAFRAGAAATRSVAAVATTELDRPSHWNRSITKASSPNKRSRLRTSTSATTAKSAEAAGSVHQQSPKANKRSRLQEHTDPPKREVIANGVNLAESLKSACLPKAAATSLAAAVDITSVSFKPSFFEQGLVASQAAAAEDISSDCDNDKANSMNFDLADGNRMIGDPSTKAVLLSPSKSTSWRPAFDSSITASTAQLSPQSGRKRQRGSKPSGPVSQLLQRLRTRYEGDAARLLSGEYPFRTGRVDLSDPRSRCSCAVDVTILQQCSTAIASTHLHVLCYVHQVSILKQSAQTPTKQLTDDTTDAAQAVYQQYMTEHLPLAVAKLILRADVNNTLRLGYGVQLRVYDPLVLHAVSHGESVSQTVMTADLCESYPSQQLQALSTPPGYNMWDRTAI